VRAGSCCWGVLGVWRVHCVMGAVQLCSQGDSDDVSWSRWLMGPVGMDVVAVVAKPYVASVARWMLQLVYLARSVLALDLIDVPGAWQC
jgi:hypothetical protein